MGQEINNSYHWQHLVLALALAPKARSFSAAPFRVEIRLKLRKLNFKLFRWAVCLSRSTNDLPAWGILEYVSQSPSEEGFYCACFQMRKPRLREIKSNTWWKWSRRFRSLDSLPSALSRAQPCQCSARWRTKMLRDLMERDVRVFKNIYCFVRNDCKYYISKMI